MTVEQMRKALYLHGRLNKAQKLVRDLNEINGGDMTLSMPSDVFEHVDRELAAKGLLSLMIEAVASYERQLRDMGVEI